MVQTTGQRKDSETNLDSILDTRNLKLQPFPYFNKGTYVIPNPDKELFDILICSAISEIVPYSANNNPNFHTMVKLVQKGKYIEVIKFISGKITTADPNWTNNIHIWDCKREDLPDPRDLVNLNDLLCFLITLEYLTN